ncbi:MAG: hypothetical protein PV362_13140 [Providencia heimbachae]|nr:hypothetical protein [Providencia heimbachae]
MSPLNDKTHGDVIIILTSSWRYFVLGALLAFICQFILFICGFSNRFYLFIGALIFIINQYYIYRLWLDNHFFRLIYRQGNVQAFDQAMLYFFPKKQTNKNIEQRWFGTKNLFNNALFSVVSLWVWLLFSIAIFSF